MTNNGYNELFTISSIFIFIDLFLFRSARLRRDDKYQDLSGLAIIDDHFPFFISPDENQVPLIEDMAFIPTVDGD